MKQIKYFFILLVFLAGCTTKVKEAEPLAEIQIEGKTSVKTSPSSPHTEAVEPRSFGAKPPPNDAIWLENKYFKTLYSKKQNIAYYSEYTVTKEELCQKKGERRDNFHGNKELKKLGLPMPVKSWYYQPWDRGHLAPAEDFSRSQEAIDTTFLMSNMTPQKKLFNQQAWKDLESQVRGWGIHEGKIQVITGPILEEGLPKLKKKPVPIPKRHFKAILDLTEPKKMIGFIMPQTDSVTGLFKNRVVTIQEIEKKVGINLFDESEEIEAKSDLTKWEIGKCK